MNSIALFILQAAGCFLLVSFVYLLAKRILILDPKTGKAVEFDFPILGKFKTQSPAVVGFFLGAGLVFLGAYLSDPDHAIIRGSLTTAGKEVRILVVAVPDYEQILTSSNGDFQIVVPLVGKHSTYKARFVAEGNVFQERFLNVNKGRADLGEIHYQPAPAEPPLPVRKAVSDVDLQKMGIH